MCEAGCQEPGRIGLVDWLYRQSRLPLELPLDVPVLRGAHERILKPRRDKNSRYVFPLRSWADHELTVFAIDDYRYRQFPFRRSWLVRILVYGYSCRQYQKVRYYHLLSYTYPHVLTTSRMMATPHNAALRPSFMGTLHSIHRTAGLRGFFAGLSPCILRAFPANACAFYVYEGLMRTFGAEKVCVHIILGFTSDCACHGRLDIDLEASSLI